MSLGPQGNTVTCPCCTLYEQHTPCCTQNTHKHMPAYAAVFCDSEQRMSQRYARVPFLLCKFRTCLQQPRSVVSALCLCSTFYVYFTHMAAAAIAEGSCLLRAWSGCSVITGFLQPTSSGAIKGDIAARCPGTGSTWHKSCDSPHMPAAHSLLLQACSG
jgi:hypothetical protein